MTIPLRTAAGVPALLFLAIATSARAVDAAHLDPGRPPAAALAAAADERAHAQAAGAVRPGLSTQVRRQLQAAFEAADTAHAGTLTRAQAQAGGFGWLAAHFDEVDTRHAGAVRFDDVRAWLHARDPRYVD